MQKERSEKKFEKWWKDKANLLGHKNPFGRTISPFLNLGDLEKLFEQWHNKNYPIDHIFDLLFHYFSTESLRELKRDHVFTRKFQKKISSLLNMADEGKQKNAFQLMYSLGDELFFCSETDKPNTFLLLVKFSAILPQLKEIRELAKFVLIDLDRNIRSLEMGRGKYYIKRRNEIIRSLYENFIKNGFRREKALEEVQKAITNKRAESLSMDQLKRIIPPNYRS